jgi:L-amino acid N-acyltransferase YncA
MIRNATEEDLSRILEIYNHAILNTTAIYDYKPHTIDDRKKWYEDKKKAGYPLIVFEEDNEVVGFAAFGSFRPFPAYKYSIEHSLYVHKDYRNKGIATSLMRELIKISNEMEYAIMVAGIDSQNTTSISLHEKLGFKYCGTVKKAGYKFGRWLDVMFYQLDLIGPKTPVEE